MAIRFGCKSCHARIRAVDASAGREIRCPRCGKWQAVPEASETLPEALTEPPPGVPERITIPRPRKRKRSVSCEPSITRKQSEPTMKQSLSTVSAVVVPSGPDEPNVLVAETGESAVAVQPIEAEETPMPAALKPTQEESESEALQMSFDALLEPAETDDEPEASPRLRLVEDEPEALAETSNEVSQEDVREAAHEVEDPTETEQTEETSASSSQVLEDGDETLVHDEGVREEPADEECDQEVHCEEVMPEPQDVPEPTKVHRSAPVSPTRVGQPRTLPTDRMLEKMKWRRERVKQMHMLRVAAWLMPLAAAIAAGGGIVFSLNQFFIQHWWQGLAGVLTTSVFVALLWAVGLMAQLMCDDASRDVQALS